MTPMRERPVVLVADDEHLNRFTLERMLLGEGFAPEVACDGPACRTLAAQCRPDLILLDIMMPGESGLETLHKLKADLLTADIPVILLSALSDVETKVRGFDLGAVDYITKPFQMREVMARIRGQLKLAAAYEAVIRAQAERLSQVRDAQKAILTSPADLPAAGFAVAYQPVLEAGGDFYDVLELGGGFGYFVADISGHDLKASFVTSGLKALLRQNTGPLYTSTETLKNINGVLGHVLGQGQFLTACYALLNARRTTLTVISCGHPPPVHVPAQGGPPRLMQTQGDILGVFDSISLAPLCMSVHPGDRIYLYTDGLVESEEWDMAAGTERLLAACASCRGQSLAESVETIREAMCCCRTMTDDAVLLGVEA